MTNSLTVRKHALDVLLRAAAACFLVLHWAHLRADFPNHSRWMDWSKYTDEGWYGDAAIRHFQLGHWYVAGDFNPAAALPVWPLVEALVFRFTGVSVVAARSLSVAVFACILLASWKLIAGRHPSGSDDRKIAASAAVLLLAANPFCYVFSRIAIVEPLLTLLMLLALLVARRKQLVIGSSGLETLPTRPSSTFVNLRADAGTIVGLGVLMPAMVLTKTTAVFLMPALGWTIFALAGCRIRRFIEVAIPIGVVAAGLWLTYFLGIVRPNYLPDYRYLFSANAYTGMTRDNFVAVVAGALKDGIWIGRVLYPLALVSAVMAVARAREVKRYPMIATLLLWIAGYISFLAYHNNLQPRYYLVVAVPVTLLLVVVVDDLIVPAMVETRFRSGGFAAIAIVYAAILIPDAVETIGIVRHPEYTLVEAAGNIRAAIEQDRRSDPAHNPLVLSVSGSELSLMNGLPSICDDFGTLELIDRVKRYRPGWYVAWNAIEDDKMDALTPLYHLERVAAFPAMDDPDRNLLILYRLDDTLVTPPIVRKGRTTPRHLKTRVGQQPSTTQLKH